MSEKHFAMCENKCVTEVYSKKQIDEMMEEAVSPDHTHDGRYYTENEIDNKLKEKQDSIEGGASTITDVNLAVNRALISNGNGKVAVSPVTSTELGYLDGVTSNVQNQLNAKQSKITYGTADPSGGSNGDIYLKY